MSGSAIKAGNAFIEITARDKQLRDSLKENRRQVEGFLGKISMVAGAAVLTAAGVATAAASNMEEQLNKFNVVFADSTPAMRAWGDQFASEVGRSQRMIVEFLAATQDLLVPAGIDPAAATEVSKTLTALAVDVASFNNKADADVLRDFHAALTGGGETVKKYGVLLNVASTKAELLRQGINPAEATEAQKVYARLQVLLQGTTSAQGDAMRSGGSFANQLKRLQASGEDLAVAAGTALLPALTAIVEIMNRSLVPISQLVSENQDLVQALTAQVIAAGAVYAATKLINAALEVYAKRQAIATALSGPKGWITLAVGLAAAGVALQVVTRQLSGVADEAKDAAASMTQLSDAAQKVAEVNAAIAERQRLRASQEAGLAESTADVTKLMEHQTTKAEKLSKALGTLAEYEARLKTEHANTRGRDAEFTSVDIDAVRQNLIDSMTGYGAEIRRVQDEIGKLDGTATETSIKLRDLAAEGVPKERIEQLRKAFAELDELRQGAEDAQVNEEQKREFAEQEARKQKGFEDRASEIQDLLKTPAEKFAELVEEVKTVVKSTPLTVQDANAFLIAEQNKMKQAIEGSLQDQQKAAESFRKQASQDVRSSAGQSLIAGLMNRTGDVEKSQLATLNRIEQLNARVLELTERGAKKANV